MPSTARLAALAAILVLALPAVAQEQKPVNSDGPQQAPTDSGRRPGRTAPIKDGPVNQDDLLGIESQKQSRVVSDATSELWGDLDGKRVRVHTLRNSKGTIVRATDYGTIITEVIVPDREGNFADVALGRKSLMDYVESNPYFGCTAGRCANRIAGGKFTIDGTEHQVTTNNGPNHLHGGAKGFDKVVWDGTTRMTPKGPTVQFRYQSPAGEEGYPGTVSAMVTYTLTENNELIVDMSASTDAKTPVNLAHHTYWNLGGHDSGDILGHELSIPANLYTPVDDTLITTGGFAKVADTPYDFRVAKPIGRDIAKLPATATDPGGYDVNFVIDIAGERDRVWPCARLADPRSGRVLEIFSNQPGIQFYSGNFLDGITGKNGATYEKFDGLCLETQAFPDSVNKQGVEGWPNVILEPRRIYRHRMVHKFSTE